MTTPTINMGVYPGSGLRLTATQEQQPGLKMNKHYWRGTDQTLECVKPATESDPCVWFKIGYDVGEPWHTTNDQGYTPGPDRAVRATFKSSDIGLNIVNVLVAAEPYDVRMLTDDIICVTIPDAFIAERKEDLMADTRPHATPFPPKDPNNGPGGVALEEASERLTLLIDRKHVHLPAELVEKIRETCGAADKLQYQRVDNCISPRTSHAKAIETSYGSVGSMDKIAHLKFEEGLYAYTLRYDNPWSWSLTLDCVLPA